MPQERVYGTPVGVEKPSGDRGRQKKRDPDIAKVREALSKFADTRAVEKVAPRPRGSSSTMPRKQRPPPILDAEIEKQSR